MPKILARSECLTVGRKIELSLVEEDDGRKDVYIRESDSQVPVRCDFRSAPILIRALQRLTFRHKSSMKKIAKEKE